LRNDGFIHLLSLFIGVNCPDFPTVLLLSSAGNGFFGQIIVTIFVALRYEEKTLENFNRDREEVYTKKIRAGKRTYFFDIRSTKAKDYYITITESKRKQFPGEGGKEFEKHKIFLYKEDFNKFLAMLTESIDQVKTELMPDYDYDSFDRERNHGDEGSSNWED